MLFAAINDHSIFCRKVSLDVIEMVTMECFLADFGRDFFLVQVIPCLDVLEAMSFFVLCSEPLWEGVVTSFVEASGFEDVVAEKLNVVTYHCYIGFFGKAVDIPFSGWSG